MTDKSYMLYVTKQLILSAKIHDIDPNVLVGYLGEQVVTMQTCDPNFPKGRSRPIRRNLNKDVPVGQPMSKKDLETQDQNMWIVRDFYPDSKLMFKISLIHVIKEPEYPGDPQQNYWVARASLVVPKAFNNEKLNFHSGRLAEYQLERVMETSLLGGSTVKPIIGETSYIKMPRRMAPKGMKL